MHWIVSIIFIGIILFICCLPSRQTLQIHDSTIRILIGITLIAFLVLWGPIFVISQIISPTPFYESILDIFWYVVLCSPLILVVYHLATLRTRWGKKLLINKVASDEIITKCIQYTSQLGIKKAPEVVISNVMNASPVVFGIWGNYTLVLPANFKQLLMMASRKTTSSPEILEKYTLLHELSHIKNRESGFISIGNVLFKALLLSIALLFVTAIINHFVVTSEGLVNRAFLTRFIEPMILISIVALGIYYLDYNGLCRKREFLADARAQLHLTKDEKESLLSQRGRFLNQDVSLLECFLLMLENMDTYVLQDSRVENAENSFSHKFRKKIGNLLGKLKDFQKKHGYLRKIVNYILERIKQTVGSAKQSLGDLIDRLITTHPTSKQRQQALQNNSYTQFTTLAPDWECVFYTSFTVILLLIASYYVIAYVANWLVNLIGVFYFGIAFYPAVVFTLPIRNAINISVDMRTFGNICLKILLFILLSWGAYFLFLIKIVPVKLLTAFRLIAITVTIFLVNYVVIVLLLMTGISNVYLYLGDFFKNYLLLIVAIMAVTFLPHIFVFFVLFRLESPELFLGYAGLMFLIAVLIFQALFAIQGSGAYAEIKIGRRFLRWYETPRKNQAIIQILFLTFFSLLSISSVLLCIFAKPFLWANFQNLQLEGISIIFCLGLVLFIWQSQSRNHRKNFYMSNFLQPFPEICTFRKEKIARKNISSSILENFQNEDGGICYTKYSSPSHLDTTVDTLFAFECTDRHPTAKQLEKMTSFVMSCYKKEGFSLVPGGTVNLISTYKAVWALKILQKTQMADSDAIIKWCLSLKNKEGWLDNEKSKSGRIRDTFYGISIIKILSDTPTNEFTSTIVWLQKISNTILRANIQDLFRVVASLQMLEILTAEHAHLVLKARIFPKLPALSKLPLEKNYLEVFYSIALLECLRPFGENEYSRLGYDYNTYKVRLATTFDSFVNNLLATRESK